MEDIPYLNYISEGWDRLVWFASFESQINMNRGCVHDRKFSRFSWSSQPKYYKDIAQYLIKPLEVFQLQMDCPGHLGSHVLSAQGISTKKNRNGQEAFEWFPSDVASSFSESGFWCANIASIPWGFNKVTEDFPTQFGAKKRKETHTIFYLRDFRDLPSTFIFGSQNAI